MKWDRGLFGDWMVLRNLRLKESTENNTTAFQKELGDQPVFL